MATNKVIFGNETIMDITDSTVTTNNLLNGEVGYASDGSRVVGSVIVPDELNDLSDIDISSVTDGQVLKYNSTTHKWENANDGGSGGLTLLSYGKSTWSDFITAYNSNSIVYCRASSNSDPSSGSQTRLAFMAYVNNETTPTQVEFQYYRSVTSHSDSQQGDQVYIYLLKNTGDWSVTVRNAFTKIKAGTNMTSSYSSGTLTLNATGGGSNVSVSQKTSSGTNIADITVDGTTTQLYAPTPTDVVANPSSSATDELTKLQVGNTVYRIPTDVVQYDVYTKSYVAQENKVTRNDSNYPNYKQIEIDLAQYLNTTLVITNSGNRNYYGYTSSKPTNDMPLNSPRQSTTGSLTVKYTGGNDRFLIYDFTSSNESDNVIAVAKSSGSNIVVTPITSTGTNIADITVDGTTSHLYAPTAAIPTMSTNVIGGAMVDGSTITINNGVISAHGASSGALNGLTDVNVPLPQNGQVLTYDSNNHQWVSANCPSGGMFPHLVITSDTRSVVTVTKGQTILTPTETSSGVYEVDVNDWGDWTVTSVLDGDTITVIAHVDEVKEIHVDARHFWATITVTFPTGSVVTCAASGETTLYANGPSPYTFMVHSVNEWVISRDFHGDIDRQTINIVAKEQHADVDLDIPLIFGISTSDNVSYFTRTDLSENFTFTPSVGNQAGYSDFDDYYPWSEIERVTIGEDIMVKIPKFYVQFSRTYKSYVTTETIRITDKPRDGFVIHPAFVKKDVHGVETEYDYIYVGAYETSAGFVSQSAKTPLTNLTRAQFRTGSKKQAGFYQWDCDTLSAIKILMYVEMGGTNSQALIGDGYTGAGASDSLISTGSCDSVPNLTGRPAGQSDLVGVVYRGIENLWGNSFSFIDACLHNKFGTLYVSNDPELYNDSDPTGWIDLRAQYPTSGVGNVFFEYEVNAIRMLPKVSASNITTSQGLCDTVAGPDVQSSGSYYLMISGGSLTSGQGAGVFYLSPIAANGYGNTVGSRLMYIPQGE